MVDERIADLGALRALMETYEALAANDIRKLRANIGEHRAFYDAIKMLFQDVHASYQSDIETLQQEGTTDADEGGARKDGALVLITPNTSLNGEIVPAVFREFRDAVSRAPDADLVVVGFVGKVLMERLLPDMTFVYLPVPEERAPSETFLRAASRHLWQYRRVTLCHGISEQLLSMRAISSVVRGEEDVDTQLGTSATRRRYLFEPSFSTVVRFFETEVFTALFEERLRESALARFSSRLILLDQSISGIERATTAASVERRRLLHRLEGRKQLGTMASVAFWGDPFGRASIDHSMYFR